MKKTTTEQIEYLRHPELRAFLEADATGTVWQTVYWSFRDGTEDGLWYCALVPAKRSQEILGDYNWDLHVGQGRPGCSQSGSGDTAVVSYDRLGFHGGIEPLVHVRDFAAIKDGYLEIAEEFRFFHNIYQGKNKQELSKFDDAGHPEPVVKIAPDRVQIRTRELRQFLAVKEMDLALFFDISRYAEIELKDFPVAEADIEFKDGQACYHFGVRDCNSHDPFRTHAFCMGKKLIPPFPKQQSGLWPFEKKSEVYPTFIIGTDGGGSTVEFTCNHGQLANNFGANADAAHYLTPVHFRPEVLGKYYSQPDRYSVEDGYLRAAGLWGLKMDNDHSDRVIVFLGDLGRDLPAAERTYWRSFNVPPQGGLSKTAYTRKIRGWFASPSRPDLVFKSKLGRFNKSWQQQFGWPLFVDLAPADAHHLIALRIPLSNDQAEFDGQVQSLTIVLIDSLNEAQLANGLTLEPGVKGITKLKAFLEARGVAEASALVTFLRNLQALRSASVAHRKGSEYEKIASVFDLENKELKEVFTVIFRSANEMLDILERTLLPPPKKSG